jgi:hypothetical protein
MELIWPLEAGAGKVDDRPRMPVGLGLAATWGPYCPPGPRAELRRPELPGLFFKQLIMILDAGRVPAKLAPGKGGTRARVSRHNARGHYAPGRHRRKKKPGDGSRSGAK